MNQDHRVLLALAVNATLCIILSQANGALSGISFYLTLDTLYFIFAALYFRAYQGLIVVAISALAVDSLIPVSFGQSLIVYSIAYLLALRMRFRMRRENPFHVAIIAVSANAVVYALNTLAPLGTGMPSGPYWIRCASDFLLSELLIALLAALYVRMERELFNQVGIDLASELQVL